ncbi:type IV conjugative transfer system lipoprotein TraV [Paucibacter sp. O1-1]|nr:type IV conjugative transfer system lipoprotein TraV [Paucibacter sp. O1-1]MDA3825028.1 type IV conjugative transfer system lipoprotein TraV [Paucibacter sp. O1-1]
MSTVRLRAAVLALLMPLVGCVNMSGLSGESKYACAAPEGVACNSVSGTYANAVAHNLPSQQGRSNSSSGANAGTASEAATASTGRNKAAAPPTPTRQALSGALASVAQPGADGRPGVALRSQARVLRLWTKPWEDADGDLWDQGFVYVQVDAGRWQIDHVRQRIRDQYTPLRPPPPASSGAAPAGTSDTSSTDPQAQTPADSTVQRPSPFSFPSLSRPPTALSPRPQ